MRVNFMNKSKLFEIKKRTETRPSTGNENAFKYYNDTGRIDVIPVREIMEIWFEIYPDNEKDEMRSRLVSDFGPAFYELGLYSYFKNLGYLITIHPTVPNSTKHPDFLVHKNGVEFYVEIKEMQLESEVERLKNRRMNTLTDSMNLIDSTNFMICIETIRFKSGNQPSGKKVIKHFDNLIKSFEPESYREKMEKSGYEIMPTLQYEDNDVYIAIKLLPKLSHLRGKIGRAVASYGAYSKIGGDEETIKNALQSKASRYGVLDKPFLICLNYPSSFLRKEDIDLALYGSESFFGTVNNPKNTRVSAVLITSFTVSGLVNAKHYFYPNPYAKREIEFSPAIDLKSSLSLTKGYIKEFG